MVDNENILTHEEEAHATFAHAICNRLKDTEVEIYCGNNSRTIRFAEIDNSLFSIIHGIVKDAVGDCLIVECNVPDKGKNLLYINAWSIESIMPVKNGMSINDFYHDDVSIQEQKRKFPRGI